MYDEFTQAPSPPTVVNRTDGFALGLVGGQVVKMEERYSQPRVDSSDVGDFSLY